MASQLDNSYGDDNYDMDSRGSSTGAEEMDRMYHNVCDSVHTCPEFGGSTDDGSTKVLCYCYCGCNCGHRCPWKVCVLPPYLQDRAAGLNQRPPLTRRVSIPFLAAVDQGGTCCSRNLDEGGDDGIGAVRGPCLHLNGRGCCLASCCDLPYAGICSAWAGRVEAALRRVADADADVDADGWPGRSSCNCFQQSIARCWGSSSNFPQGLGQCSGSSGRQSYGYLCRVADGRHLNYLPAAQVPVRRILASCC